MAKKQTFIVTIEYPSKDGCGNEVPSYTEGEIKRAISKLRYYSSLSVEEVDEKTLRAMSIESGKS